MEININGFEYSKEEVLEALKNKGYLILKQKFSRKESAKAVVNSEENEIYALKGKDLPDESNRWHHVAYREFRRMMVKPPLA